MGPANNQLWSAGGRCICLGPERSKL